VREHRSWLSFGGLSFPDNPHELTKGFHRLVALRRLGLEIVRVVRVDDEATEERERLKRVAKIDQHRPNAVHR